MQSQIHKDYLPAFKLTENDRVFLLGKALLNLFQSFLLSLFGSVSVC